MKKKLDTYLQKLYAEETNKVDLGSKKKKVINEVVTQIGSESEQRRGLNKRFDNVTKGQKTLTSQQKKLGQLIIAKVMDKSLTADEVIRVLLKVLPSNYMDQVQIMLNLNPDKIKQVPVEESVKPINELFGEDPLLTDEEGNSQEYQRGYDDGYEEGYNYGYEDGYKEGIEKELLRRNI